MHNYTDIRTREGKKKEKKTRKMQNGIAEWNDNEIRILKNVEIVLFFFYALVRYIVPIAFDS